MLQPLWKRVCLIIKTLDMHLSDYLAILCLDIYAEKRKHMSLQRLVPEFHGSFMCYGHKWKTIPMSINSWMGKHVVGYLHNESQYAYAECRKKGKDRVNTVWVQLYAILEMQIIMTKSRLPQDWVGGRIFRYRSNK